MLRRHAALMMEFKGEYTGIREMRKHAAWYTAGYPNSARLRARMNDAEHIEDLLQLLEEFSGEEKSFFGSGKRSSRFNGHHHAFFVDGIGARPLSFSVLDLHGGSDFYDCFRLCKRGFV